MMKIDDEKHKSDRTVLMNLIQEAYKHDHDTGSLMLIPLNSIFLYIDEIKKNLAEIQEDYDYVRSGTILEIGEGLKERPDFDKDRWIRSLEKELFRLIKASKDQRKYIQEKYSEKKTILHALWISRAERARLEKFASTGWESYHAKHPNSTIGMKRWYSSWWKAEARCREYAKKFE